MKLIVLNESKSPKDPEMAAEIREIMSALEKCTTKAEILKVKAKYSKIIKTDYQGISQGGLKYMVDLALNQRGLLD